MPIGVFSKKPCKKGCGLLLDPRGAHYHEDKCLGPKAPGPLPKSWPKGQRTTGPSTVLDSITARSWLDRVTVAEVIEELQEASDGCRSAADLVRIAAERVAKRKGRALIPVAPSFSLSELG